MSLMTQEIDEIDSPEFLEREIGLYLARNNLIDFTEKTYPQYITAWYHKLICSKLDSLLCGKIKRLMIFTAPQHGKSELVSRRFPAFALGRNPDEKIAACSYSADLAEKFNREVQRIIDMPEYHNIFPNTVLSGSKTISNLKGSYLRNSSIFEIVEHGGIYKSVGVGGPLTGNKVDLGIIDDPIKDRMEAQSETFRNRIWEWYLDVFSTRLHNDSRQLLTMTRWHEDDLAGRLLATEPERWEVLSLPAIREDMINTEDPRAIGEALWPERHSLDNILQIKAKSDRTFTSMYQQRPAPADGNIIKRTQIKYYKELPRLEKIVQSWDVTFEGKATSDFVACTVWGKSGSRAYLLYMLRGKWDFVQTINEIRKMNKLFPQTAEKIIERKANGSAVISLLEKEIPGLIPFDPGSDSKEARAYMCSFLFEAGNVYFPEGRAWVNDVVSELSTFPNGKNDDIVDTITQFLIKTYLKRQGQAILAAY